MLKLDGNIRFVVVDSCSTHSLSPSLFVLFFLFIFHSAQFAHTLSHVACLPNAKLPTTTIHEPIAFFFPVWNDETCEMLFGAITIFFLHFSKCKSVSSSFCLFVRRVRLFINEIQYYTGYELWALCITLLHRPLFLAVYYSFYVLIFNFHCTLFPLRCRSI